MTQHLHSILTTSQVVAVYALKKEESKQHRMIHWHTHTVDTHCCGCDLIIPAGSSESEAIYSQRFTPLHFMRQEGKDGEEDISAHRSVSVVDFQNTILQILYSIFNFSCAAVVTVETNRCRERKNKMTCNKNPRSFPIVGCHNYLIWQSSIGMNYIHIGRHSTSQCTSKCALYIARCKVVVVDTFMQETRVCLPSQTCN